MKLFDMALQHPERTLCICDDGKRILYRELMESAEIFRKRAGREMVFILCRNTPGSLLGYLGCLAGGGAALLLDADLEPALLTSLLLHYKPAWICAPSEDKEKIQTAARKAGMEISPGNAVPIEDSTLIRTGMKGPELHPDLCLLLTTSGSTGSPKLVRISRGNLDANTKSIVQYLAINEEERPVTTLPMNYSYGMSVINTHVYCGATILLTQYTLLEKAFWKRVREEGATSLAGVPFTYKMLDRLGLTGMDLPALRTLTQAGGKLPERLHRKFGTWCMETGRRFFVMYGQTEASPRMGYLPAESTMTKCGSMGVAIPGGRLVLLDDDGKEILQPGAVGELVYYGENVSMGYAQCREDLRRGDEFGGVLKTGDMAQCDRDGFFYIVGRKKRFIKIAGKRFGLDETERLLGSMFPEEEIVCTGKDDHMQIYVCGADEARCGEIESRTMDTMHIPQSMITVCGIEEIPRNDAGKVQYGDLEERGKR